MMRAVTVWAGLLLLAATPVGAQSVPAISADRAYSLVGTWSCQSALGSVSTLTYTRPNDTTIVLVNKFMFRNGELGEFDESYATDADGKRWTWSGTYAGHPGFKQIGSAGPWTGDDWTIDGQLTVTPQAPYGGPAQVSGTRMIYSRVSDEYFRREVDVQNDGKWVPSSSSLCKRSG